MKSLSLIQAIVLLNDQKCPNQKPQKIHPDLSQFEHTWENIDLANKLAHEILGRTLLNLSGLSSLLLLLIDEMVDKACVTQQISRIDFRFTMEEIKKYTGWSSPKLILHLEPLKKQHYLKEEEGMYELVYHKKERKLNASLSIERFKILT